MNILEEIKSRKKHLLTEQEGGSTSAAVGGFYGRHGQDVDTTYYGPFHPDYGELGKTLQWQLDRNDSMKIWNMEVTPVLKDIFELVGVEYKIDEPISDKDKEKLKKFINDSDKMQLVDTGIKYDKPTNRSKEETQNLLNKTNDWQEIYKNKKDKTEKLINKKNNWQEIYKNKKDKTTSGVENMLNAWR